MPAFLLNRGRGLHSGFSVSLNGRKRGFSFNQSFIFRDTNKEWLLIGGEGGRAAPFIIPFQKEQGMVPFKHIRVRLSQRCELNCPLFYVSNLLMLELLKKFGGCFGRLFGQYHYL